MGLLDQAHSFAQGASNGVASSLTGPVDGLAWLLRKAGVPVPQAPLGGSDWMRNVGLMQEPKERMAGLLGEGIGSALPTVIAGKAPQIANGLLQMERNAMAPRTLNPQTGAIVWHGSPHKFDKFDSNKIGTGEGAQAYGHGLYLAESPDVARGYQEKLTDPSFKYVGQNQAKARINEKIAQRVEATDPARAAKLRSEVASLSDPGGALYKVDLPDDQIAKMLDWDKPLSQQHPEVNAKLKHALGSSYKESMYGEDAYRRLQKIQQNQAPIIKKPDGAYRNDAVVPQMTSDALRQSGIPGIRYLDGGSRASGAGTSNYVVFPGNEGLLKILERNGQGLPGN